MGENLIPIDTNKKNKEYKVLRLSKEECSESIIQLCVMDSLPYNFFSQPSKR